MMKYLNWRVFETDFRAPNRYLQNEGKFYSFRGIKRKTPETVETKTDCKKCNAMDSVPPVNVRILNFELTYSVLKPF